MGNFRDDRASGRADWFCGRRLQAEMIEPDEFLSEMIVRPSAPSNPARGHPSSSGPALT